MKKFFAAILLVLYLIPTLGMIVFSQEEMVKESVSAGSHSLDAVLPVLGTTQLITNAKSAILYEVNTDTLMHSWNADEKMSPASFVKILTALIAIEQGDLNSTVTVSQSVLDSVVYNAVKTGFMDTEVLTLQDLLYCMMVDSGNDAAALIANHIAGSQSAFVDTLNSYAQELGCTNTNFTNVHGLHDDNQYTTARDMGRIMAAAVKNEIFCTIIGTKYYNVPATNLSEDRYLVSENYLINNDTVQIYYDKRVIGARTGVAQDGSRCITALAEHNGLRYISVIMGSESVYEENGVQVKSFGGYAETSDLLDLGFEGYQSCQLIYNGQILKQKKVLNGDCSVSLGTREAAYAVLPAGVVLSDLTSAYTDVAEELQAPVQAGQQLSTVKFMHGNICVAQVPLYAMNHVNSVSEMIIEQPEKSDGQHAKSIMTILLVAVIAVLLFVAGSRIYKMISIRFKYSQGQKKRRNRRRS